MLRPTKDELTIFTELRQQGSEVLPEILYPLTQLFYDKGELSDAGLDKFFEDLKEAFKVQVWDVERIRSYSVIEKVFRRN